MQSLLHSLHQLPDLAILALIVLVVAGAVMAAPHLGRHVFRLPKDEGRSEAALDAFKAIMGMTGVVLAFALVEANTNLHTIEGVVAKEGAAISATDRALLRSGNPQLIKLRPALAAYGKAIVEDEWPLLADADRSDEVDDAYNDLSRQARAVDPVDARQQAIFAELLKSLDDMADFREQRLADSDAALPSFFWVTASGLMIVGFILALLSAPTLSDTVAVGATAAAVALILAFVVIVDQPFDGDTSVKPKEITKALQLNDRRV